VPADRRRPISFVTSPRFPLIFCSQKNGKKRSMDTIRKGNRADQKLEFASSKVPLPVVTTKAPIRLPENSTTNNRVSRNKLQDQPIDPRAEIERSQRQIQEQQQLLSQYQGVVTPHTKRAPVERMPPMGSANHVDLTSLGSAAAPLSRAFFDLTAPVYGPAAVLPAATPEMEKRVRKRIAKTLMKEVGKPLSEEVVVLKRIQKKLTTKDPALSRSIEDAEPEDSQEAIQYLKLLDSP
jgi:hypothetical protein